MQAKHKPDFARMSANERFWHFTDKNGPNPPEYSGLKTPCWLWTGNTSNGGYGMIRAYQRKLLAHRFSYELNVGPLGEQSCLHRCDNPSCVNPDHLFAGTQADNIQDMCSKSRHSYGAGNTTGSAARGTRNGSSVLSEDYVRRIRDEYALGLKGCHCIAKDYKVTKRTIHLVVTRQTWAHVA